MREGIWARLPRYASPTAGTASNLCILHPPTQSHGAGECQAATCRSPSVVRPPEVRADQHVRLPAAGFDSKGHRWCTLPHRGTGEYPGPHRTRWSPLPSRHAPPRPAPPPGGLPGRHSALRSRVLPLWSCGTSTSAEGSPDARAGLIACGASPYAVCPRDLVRVRFRPVSVPVPPMQSSIVFRKWFPTGTSVSRPWSLLSRKASTGTWAQWARNAFTLPR